MVMVSQQCPEVQVTSGSTYSFTGTVVNAGDVTLTNVVVRSARAGTVVLVGPITLLPGASAPFSGSYQIHGDCCQIVNTITVTGGDRCNGTVVNNSDSIVCPIRTNPALGVTRICNGSSFTGTVQNTGDINLTDVIVRIGEGTKLLGPINLAPGESETFSGVDSGNSAVVARGTSICKQSVVSSQATCGGETGSGIVIHTITMVGGAVAIDWSATEGSRYVVQFRDAGLTSGWHNLGGEVVASGSKNPIRTTDAAVSQPSRLYRVISAQ